MGRKGFKKKKGWVSPERFQEILKMLQSENDEDFEIAKSVLKGANIKLSRDTLAKLDTPWRWSSLFYTYEKGELIRAARYIYTSTGTSATVSNVTITGCTATHATVTTTSGGVLCGTVGGTAINITI